MAHANLLDGKISLQLEDIDDLVIHSILMQDLVSRAIKDNPKLAIKNKERNILSRMQRIGNAAVQPLLDLVHIINDDSSHPMWEDANRHAMLMDMCKAILQWNDWMHTYAHLLGDAEEADDIRNSRKDVSVCAVILGKIMELATPPSE